MENGSGNVCTVKLLLKNVMIKTTQLEHKRVL